MGITQDAVSCDETLGRRMGNLITDEEVAPDWEEYIIPDLEETFHADVLHVATAMAAARVECGGGAGPLVDHPRGCGSTGIARSTRRGSRSRKSITSARVRTSIPPALPPDNRNAFLRSQFYCAVQSLLLEYVMR